MSIIFLNICVGILVFNNLNFYEIKFKKKHNYNNHFSMCKYRIDNFCFVFNIKIKILD